MEKSDLLAKIMNNYDTGRKGIITQRLMCKIAV